MTEIYALRCNSLVITGRIIAEINFIFIIGTDKHTSNTHTRACVRACTNLYITKGIEQVRDLYFLELFIFFWHTCMFPTCYFPQRIYMAQDHMNRAPDETQTQSCRFIILMLFRFCIALYRGHCFVLDFSSSFSSSSFFLFQCVYCSILLVILP